MQITEQRIAELLASKAFTTLAEEAELSTTNYPRWGLGWKALGLALYKQALAASFLNKGTLDEVLKDSRLKEGTLKKEAALKALRRASMLLPNDAKVYKALGKLAQADNNDKQAEAYFQHVITMNPTDAATLNILGLINYENEAFDAAIHYFEQAVAANPSCFTSHIHLAKAYKENEQPKKFRVSLLKANKIAPSTEDEWVELVTLWIDSEFIKEGELLFNQFIKKFPNNNYIAYLKGIALARYGNFEKALVLFKEANNALPNNEEVLIRLAFLINKKNPEKAIKILEEAIQVLPYSFKTINMLCDLLFDNKKNEQAHAYIEKLIKIKVNHKTYHLIGYYNWAKFNFIAAAEAFENSLAINSNNLKTIILYANSLVKTEQLTKAKTFIINQLKKHPKNDGLLSLLSLVYYNLGENKKSIETSKKLLKTNPLDSKNFSNYLFFLIHSEKHTIKYLFNEHLRFSNYFEKPIKAIAPHTNNNDPSRKLKIGFVSGDMYNHAVAYFAIPTFKSLEDEQFDVSVFYSFNKEDASTLELKKLVNHWFDVTNLNDIELVDLIREESIDILIDLSGHTAHNRLPAFAYKPAPIQITSIGYPYTTGLKAMDYAFASSLIPNIEYQQQHWTEKFIITPEKPKNVRPVRSASINEPPAKLAATRNGFFTYASLNRFSKINAEALAAWVTILNSTTNTKLLLGNVEQDKNQEIISFFTQQGIAAERLILVPRVGLESYMRLFNQIDLILDTWPYGGGTTTNNAISMGVPVLSIVGDHPVEARVNTINRALNLEQFLVKDVTDYIQQAIAWSTNLEELQACRTEILSRPEKTAKILEENPAERTLNLALRMAWQRWCAGLPAASFRLPEKK